jgi:glycosyltransferase involved in cell wall biosynthesis
MHVAGGRKAHNGLDSGMTNESARSGANATPLEESGKKHWLFYVVTGLGVGGAERVVIDLAKYAHTHGWRVVVIALNDDRRILEQYDTVPFEVVSLGINGSVRSTLRGLHRLLRLISERRPRVVHAHMFHALLAVLVCRAIYSRTPIIFTSHSFAGFSLVRRWIIKASRHLRFADVVFAEGQHPSLNAPRTVVIPNGVDVGSPQRRSMQRLGLIALFVGRLVGLKNPAGLIKAFMEANVPGGELWLVGDGVLREELEQMARGSRGRIKVLGLRRDVRELLRQADCLVLASEWEGLPMVVLEAGAEAVPVIATPVGALPELLKDRRGYVATLDEFPRLIAEIAENRQEAMQRGMRLFEHVSSAFSTAASGKRHLELYCLASGERTAGLGAP